MIPDDQIVSGLSHAQDRAVGRRLVVARCPEGWRIGYQVPHYGGAQWRPSADPDHVQAPIGWHVAEWLGAPIAALSDAVAVATAVRSRVLDRVESSLEPSALLPLILDVGDPGEVIR